MTDKNEKKEKEEEQPIVKMFKKDVETAENRRKKFIEDVKRLEHGFRLAGDEQNAEEALALWKEAEGAPPEIFRDKGILYKLWVTMKKLCRWAAALAVGGLRWVVHVATAALRLIENALHDLGECFEPVLS